MSNNKFKDERLLEDETDEAIDWIKGYRDEGSDSQIGKYNIFYN